MYRDGNVYEEICKEIINIYLDYGFCEFPLDEKKVCNKMGVALVPYSSYEKEYQKLLRKKSPNGFFVKGTSETSPTIYYNDKRESEGEIRFTIFHELKHFVYNENSDDNDKDDLADFFARYFMCPIPYLLLKGIKSFNEIISFCGVSKSAAANVTSNLENRKSRYGDQIFDYEIPLIEQIEPILVEVHRLRWY